MEPSLLALIKELEEDGSDVARLCAEALRELFTKVDTQQEQINGIIRRMDTGRVDEQSAGRD